jgi:hypothetical protein
MKWSEKSKVISQGDSTQGNEGVENPKMVKTEKAKSNGLASQSLVLDPSPSP